jgi:hypothetical protein
MNKNIYSLSLIAVVLSLGTWSCRLEDINENPNVPGEINVSLLLPSAQRDLANAICGRLFRYHGIAAQQLKGTDNQELLMENYNPDELFVGYPWEDLYSGPMINLALIRKDSETQQAPAYKAVANILLALCTGLITDTWGDAPVSEALQGGNQLYPRYDTQADIYAQLHAWLDEAIVLADAESPRTPGADDLVYGGDMEAWKKAAWALKARFYIHTTGVEVQSASLALDAVQQAFSTAAGNCQYPYSGAASDSNPINNFFAASAYAVVDPQFVSVMGISDPRFSHFIDIIPFTGGQSKVGDFRGLAQSPGVFIDATELKFIEAEARLRLGDQEGAEAALQAAVSQSCNAVESFLGIDLPDGDVNELVVSMALTGNFDQDLALVMEQKYIALFTSPECWTDWRRTGYPPLEPNENGNSDSNPGGEIPRRLIYPQSERLLNPNFPGSVTMQNRIWWDNN